MKKCKRVTALLLALFLGFTTGYGDVLAASAENPGYAAEMQDESRTESAAPESENTKDVMPESENTESVMPESENTESVMPESESTESPTPESEGTESTESTVPESESTESVTPEGEGTENTESTAPESENTQSVAPESTEENDSQPEDDGADKDTQEKDSEEDQSSLVNYLVVEEPVVKTPGTQRIFAGIGDGTGKVESALLTYKNTATGASYQAQASHLLDDFALFTMEFSDDALSGSYQITELTYAIDGVETRADLAKIGVDASFGVNEETNTQPDDVLLTDEDLEELAALTEASVVIMDGDNKEEQVENALKGAGCKVPASLSKSSLSSAIKGAATDNIVVVLDAGHGGTDGGTVGNGIVEKNVNLKIAQYCKEELETYKGVTVIMTRSADITLTLAQRAQVAIDNKANVFISLHNNSNESPGPNGANVYYPNNNYNSTVSQIGKDLATIIEAKLTELGLASGGIHIRNSENETKYPDGSLADYYGVIKRCKEYGIPGLIVEHAFISNAGDAANFLSTDEKLKKLGVADATGIAQYYKLTKKDGSDSLITSIKSKDSKHLVIKWNPVDDATGYEIGRAVSENGTYTTIKKITSQKTKKYTDSTVKPGKLYYYKIRPILKDGSGDWSEAASGRTAKVPSDLYVASQGGSALRVSWTADDNVAGYQITRSKSVNGKYKELATIANNTVEYFDDTTIKGGKKYYYKIQAYNYNGTTMGYSGYSSAVMGQTLMPVTIKKIAPVATKKHTIYWTAADNATGYQIFQSTSIDGTYKRIKTVKSRNTTSYTVTGLKTGVKYYYKIRSMKKKNGVKEFSDFSPAKGAWVNKKPVITEVVGYTGTKIKVCWNPLENVKSYDIYRSTSKYGKYTKVGSADGDETSYTDSKLKMNQKYYYKMQANVKGYKATGKTSLSKAVKGYTMRKTEISSVEPDAAGALVIKWMQVKNSKGYEVYRSTSRDGDYKLLTTINSAKTTSYTDSTVEKSVNYWYKVRVFTKDGKKTVYGQYSEPVEGNNLKAPSDVTVTQVSETQLDITWSAVSDAVGYIISRSTKPEDGFATLAVLGNVTTYSDTSVVKDTVYYYKIQSVDVNGRTSGYSSVASGCAMAKLVITSAQWSGGGVSVTWRPSQVAVTGYEIYRSSSERVSSVEKIGDTKDSSYLDTNVKTGVTYYYKIRSYTTVSGKNRYSGFSDTLSTNPYDYRIMGSAGATVAQMTAMYNDSKKTYPSAVYSSKGAADINAFCQIVYEESVAEGVKPEVLFAQVCLETGYLSFGGQVKAEQCNFGGLGALDTGESGAVFPDVRTGIRAQVQHLKAYASVDALRQPCVDPRFSGVPRGRAEYVQQLGSGNWATDPAYAAKLMNNINAIKGK